MLHEEQTPLIGVETKETYNQFQARVFAEALTSNLEEQKKLQEQALKILGEDPSFFRKLLPFAVPFATNAGIYLTLTLLLPEFVFSSLIASAASSAAALLAHRLSGLRPNTSFGRDTPFFLNGLGLSEGVRPVGEMLVGKLFGLPNIGTAVATGLPSLAQTMLFFDDSRGNQDTSKKDQLATLRKNTIENRV